MWRKANFFTPMGVKAINGKLLLYTSFNNGGITVERPALMLLIIVIGIQVIIIMTWVPVKRIIKKIKINQKNVRSDLNKTK